MESLPHDVIESILERIDAKTLVKFKSVSKLWRSTIQSPNFQQRQLIQRQSRGGDPDLLLVSLYDPNFIPRGSDFEAMRTLTLGSSPSVSIQIPTPWENKVYDVCKSSCDGLVYLNTVEYEPSVVVNPTTLWYRIVPLCNYQLLADEKAGRGEFFDAYPSPGFGKDIIGDTYKSVWLYNSAELGINDNPTTCEVFDFVTNSWRYVVPASPCLISQDHKPVYFNGSLYWLTDLHTEIMVLSFDLHTETFEIISKVPFLLDNEGHINIYNLDSRLCVCEDVGLNQIIWSFDPVHKKWNQIYSIDLTVTIPWIGKPTSPSPFPFPFPHLPLGVLGKDKLLLFSDCEHGNSLVTLDPKTKSYNLVYTSKLSAFTLCYFPSLISIL